MERGELGAPVNVVLGQRRTVVGVNLSQASLTALRWAAAEAGIRGTHLHVVRAREPTRRWAAPYSLRGHLLDTDEDRAAATARLTHAVQAVLGSPPPVTVTVEVAEGLAARVLLDRASGADLLVLGAAVSTGHDSLGPVARACLRHPPCPVVVVAAERAAVGVAG